MISGDIESAYIGRTAKSNQGAGQLLGFKNIFLPRYFCKGAVRRFLPRDAPGSYQGEVPTDLDRPEMIPCSESII